MDKRREIGEEQSVPSAHNLAASAAAKRYLITVVILFKVVVPDTCNELLMVVILFYVVIPETFNELLIVVILFNVVVPDTI